MFCKKCGATLEPEDKFCASCGEVVNSEAADIPVQQPVYQQPTQQQPIYQQPIQQPIYQQPIQQQPMYQQPVYQQMNNTYPGVQPNSKGKKLIPLLVCAGVAVLAVILVLVFVVFSSGAANTPQGVLENFFKTATAGDINSALKYSIYDTDFDGIIKMMCEKQGITEKEFNDQLKMMGMSKSNVLKIAQDSMTNQLKSKYGNDYKTSFEFLNEKSFTEDEVIAEVARLTSRTYNDDYLLGKIAKITEIVEIEMVATISGSLDQDIDTDTYTLVKIDGNWRVYDTSMLDSLGLLN